jgi:Flp pilus assembly protein TadG
MAAPDFSVLKCLRRFVRARRGSVAIEFGFVAVPFFFLTFGLAEVAMLGLAQSSLNFAVSDTGREIRTGEAQLEGATQSEMETRICTRLNRFIRMSCEGTLFVDVQRFDSFVDVGSQDTPITNGDIDVTGFGYNAGAPSDIVVVRAFYRWRVITPMFQTFLGNVSSGDRIIVSTMMFRNEPYSS